MDPLPTFESFLNPCACLKTVRTHQNSVRALNPVAGPFRFSIHMILHVYLLYQPPVSHLPKLLHPLHLHPPESKTSYLVHFVQRQLGVKPRRSFRPFFSPMGIRTNLFHDLINLNKWRDSCKSRTEKQNKRIFVRRLFRLVRFFFVRFSFFFFFVTVLEFCSFSLRFSPFSWRFFFFQNFLRFRYVFENLPKRLIFFQFNRQSKKNGKEWKKNEVNCLCVFFTTHNGAYIIKT